MKRIPFPIVISKCPICLEDIPDRSFLICEKCRAIPAKYMIPQDKFPPIPCVREGKIVWEN